jgi:hypothetical protein
MISRWYFPLTTLALLIPLAGTPSSGAEDEVEKADEKLLQDARVGTDGPALLAFFRSRTPTEGDEQRMRQLVRQLGSDSFEAREEASRALTERGTVALKLLRAALNDPDKEIARRAEACIGEIEANSGPSLPSAAIRLLARREPTTASGVLLAYLPFADGSVLEEEVLRALAALAVRPGKVDAALTDALKDPQPRRRAAAAYALGRHSEEAQRDAVRKLLADKEPLVRLRAAQGLIAGKDREAVPVLIALLADAPADVVSQAEEVLWRLAEERSPRLPTDEDPAVVRRKYRDAWSGWWTEHGKDVDLARLGEAAPYLGLTLIAQSSAGKVWECGRDGKPRWTIGGLQGPIEARMLPGNRVLVVENDGKRVSERDLQGKILWEYKAPDRGLSAQRLPNGNTFVATNTSISEVTRAGEEVYRYKFPQPGRGSRINSACKLTTGRILVLTDDGSMDELDAATGKVLKQGRAPDGACYTIEPQPGGGCLVTAYGSGKVVELDPNGKVVWEHTLAGAFSATRLPGGNTLIASHSGQLVVEVTREGKVVWELKTEGNVWRAFRR